MGISGQTIWRQAGNFLRKQKIIRKITYYEPGFRQKEGLLQFRLQSFMSEELNVRIVDH